MHIEDKTDFPTVLIISNAACFIVLSCAYSLTAGRVSINLVHVVYLYLLHQIFVEYRNLYTLHNFQVTEQDLVFHVAKHLTSKESLDLHSLPVVFC